MLIGAEAAYEQLRAVGDPRLHPGHRDADACRPDLLQTVAHAKPTSVMPQPSDSSARNVSHTRGTPSRYVGRTSRTVAISSDGCAEVHRLHPAQREAPREHDALWRSRRTSKFAAQRAAADHAVDRLALSQQIAPGSSRSRLRPANDPAGPREARSLGDASLTRTSGSRCPSDSSSSSVIAAHATSAIVRRFWKTRSSPRGRTARPRRRRQPAAAENTSPAATCSRASRNDRAVTKGLE